MNRKMIRRLVLLSMVVTLFPLLTACGGSAKQEPIRIGIQAPYTGVGSDHGPLVEAGVRLLLEQNKWKVAGRSIELVTGDEDAMDPSVTLDRTRQLVEQKQVDILIGPIFGSNQQAVAPYLTEQQLLDISVHYGSWDLVQSGNFILWPGTDYSSATPIGDFAYNQMGYRSLSIMAPDYIFGHTLMAGPMDEFSQLGGTVLQEQWVPLGTVDMLPYMTALNPAADAIVVWLLTDNLVSFVEQYNALGLETPVIFVYTLREGTLQDIGPRIDGFYTVGDYTWRIDTPTNRAFVKAYEGAYNEKPNTTAVSAYCAAMVAVEALKATHGDTSLAAL